MKSELKSFKNLDKKSREDFAVKFIEKLHQYQNEKNIFISLENDENIKNAIIVGKIPIAIKDNVVTNNLQSTGGSKILEGYKTGFDATIVENLKKSQNIFVIGKTNMDEFGFGSFGINSGYGNTQNAWDNSRPAGGSSSGAGVYASIFPFPTISESTGGSISAPSAFNGVIGFTPTYGQISRWGLISYANSLDKIGFCARSAYDLKEFYLSSISNDKKDATCNPKNNIQKEIKKIAIVKEMLVEDKKIMNNFNDFITKLKDLGYIIEIKSIKEIEFSLASYYIISMAEASTNLNKYCGLRYGQIKQPWLEDYNTYFTHIRNEFFGKEAKRRTIVGNFVRMKGYLEKYYLKAQVIRQDLKEKFKEIFKEYDLIISPTMPIEVPKYNEIKNISPAKIYEMDKLTIPPNLIGFPHIAYPIKYDLAQSVQIIANEYDDINLLDFIIKLQEIQELKFKEDWF